MANCHLGYVTVNGLSVVTEPPVNEADPGYARFVNALHRTDPQTDVRVDRVFYQHRNICSFQRIGYLLHTERVDRGARSEPQHVDTRFETIVNVRSLGYLSSHFQSGFFFDTLEPGQPFGSYAFKTSRTGTGLPDTGAESGDVSVGG